MSVRQEYKELVGEISVRTNGGINMTLRDYLMLKIIKTVSSFNPHAMKVSEIEKRIRKDEIANIKYRTMMDKEPWRSSSLFAMISSVIQYLSKNGFLVRVRHGYYKVNHQLIDEV